MREVDPADLQIGRRLRTLRVSRKLSQEDLAKAVGITYQQLQKYESAVNRISASRLYRLSKVLGIPVSTFFEGLEES